MKRFTDTAIWQKNWFMELTPAEKLAWFYIKDQCDNVGVWEPNTRLAEFIIGSQLDWDKFQKKCNENIYVMDNGKWWLVDFCRFQHPDLDPDSASRPIQSYIKELKKHELWDRFIGYPKGTDTLSIGYRVQVREREQVRVKEREEEETPVSRKNTPKRVPDLRLGECQNILLTSDEYQRLCDEHTKELVDEAVHLMSLWKEEKGKRVKNDNLALRRWAIDAALERRQRVGSKSVAKPKIDWDEYLKEISDDAE